MTTGRNRTKRDKFRVWKRVHAGVRSVHELAEQLNLTPQCVTECQKDACVALWELIIRHHGTALIDQLVDMGGEDDNYLNEGGTP